MLLEGKKGLVLNITNKYSIGWNIAAAAVTHGAKVGMGAQSARMGESVRKLQEEAGLNEPIFQVDFQNDEEIANLVTQVKETFGSIDFVVHSAAFANREDLTGRFIDTSREGFKLALEVSCFSFINICKALEPILNPDASVMTLSYLGSVRQVGNYNVMGVAKAALESSVRYLSADLGVNGVRVNALSPGPINTAAARGVKGLGDMIDYVADRAPLKRPYAQEVGGSAVYLMSDLSKGVSGQIIYVDSGFSIVGF